MSSELKKVAGLERRVPYAEWKKRVYDKFVDSIQLPELDYNPSSTERLTVRCERHGEFMTTLKAMQKSKTGCPACAVEQATSQQRLTKELFVQRSVEKYGDLYDYSLVNFDGYTSNQHKVTIVCKEHGGFTKSVKRFLGGEGCPRCSREASVKQENDMFWSSLLEQLKQVNPSLGFSQAEFQGIAKKIKVICPTHGEQWCGIKLLKSGKGCSECYRESLKYSRDEWLKKFEETHGTHKYKYLRMDERPSSRGVVDVWCNECEITFSQEISSHSLGHGCPMCKIKSVASGPSKQELEVLDFIKTLTNHEVNSQVPVLLGEKRFVLDIVCPDLKLAVEFNGVYFHSQRFLKDTRYHLNKTKAAAEQGWHLVHIFEDDWKFRNAAVRHMLSNRFGQIKKVGARKTRVVPVDKETAVAFYQDYHVQGSSRTPNQTHYGLSHEGELIAVMSFSQHASKRVVLEESEWELVRFASRYSVQGGASKLFKAFVKECSPTKVVSFSMNHLFTGGVYSNLGFTVECVLPPDYTYVDKRTGRRLHKAGFQHSVLKRRFKDDYIEGATERQICESLGYYRIYDCGKTRWTWVP